MTKSKTAQPTGLVGIVKQYGDTRILRWGKPKPVVIGNFLVQQWKVGDKLEWRKLEFVDYEDVVL